MKSLRIPTTLAVLTFTLLAGGVNAYAQQNSCSPGTCNSFIGCPTGQFCNGGNVSGSACLGTCVASDSTSGGAPATQNYFPGLLSNSSPSPASTSTPGTTNQPSNGGLKDPGSSYDGVMTWIMGLFAWLVGVAALTLDTSVYYTVVHMGSYVNNLSAVGVTWRILRDIGNILLIFGFIAVGINIILGVNWYGGGSKMLPMLLIAAVFLNFSLFMAEAIIDVGNLFGTEFYTQITGGQPPGTATGNVTGLSSLNTAINQEGIANRLMAQLGLQSIYNAAENQQILKAGNMWFVGFMGILLFLTTAFVMFSLAFMFIARFVVLIFLIIAAPVGLVGLAVPNLAGRAKQWWSELFKQTITAPVLLLMLYVALAVITDAQFLTGFNVEGTGSTASNNVGNAWDSIFGVVNNGQGFAPFAGMMLSFLVAMGLLFAVIVLAKSLGAAGASWATRTAGSLTFGAVSGAIGFTGRRTLGRGSGVLARTIKSSSFGRTEFGRLAAGVADYGAKASYDSRGAKSVSSGFKALGIEAGAAQKGGYAKIQKEATEARSKYAQELKLTGSEQKEKDELETKLKDAKDAQTLKLREIETDTTLSAEEKTRRLDEASKEYKKIEKDIQNGTTDPKTGEKLSRGLNDFKTVAQEKYVEHLEARSAVFKPGTGIDTLIRPAAGAGLGLGAGAVVGASLAGVGAGAALGGGYAGAYLFSAAQRANKEAVGKIKAEMKKSKQDKEIEALTKAIKDSAKKKKSEEEEEEE